METAKKTAKRPLMFLMATVGLAVLFLAKWTGVYDVTASDMSAKAQALGVVNTAHADTRGSGGGHENGSLGCGNCSSCGPGDGF